MSALLSSFKRPLTGAPPGRKQKQRQQPQKPVERPHTAAAPSSSAPRSGQASTSDDQSRPSTAGALSMFSRNQKTKASCATHPRLEQHRLSFHPPETGPELISPTGDATTLSSSSPSRNRPSSSSSPSSAQAETDPNRATAVILEAAYRLATRRVSGLFVCLLVCFSVCLAALSIHHRFSSFITATCIGCFSSVLLCFFFRAFLLKMIMLLTH